jgi:uncharacterized repeat protein (TIGR03803 family)
VVRQRTRLGWRVTATLGAMVAFGAAPTVAAQSAMQVIYAFAAAGDPGFANGSGPESGVYLGPGGNLWGTTYSGGAVPCGGYNCGVVYWAAPAPGSQVHVVHSFKGDRNNAQDGYFPASNVVAMGGSLVGTTKYGGSPTCMQKAQPHCGVIFTSHLFNKQGYRVVHKFTGGADGGLPNDLMLSSRTPGTVFGTTSAGTASGAGTVFRLVNKDNSWRFQTLYTFMGGHDGGVPNAGLVEDANGNLYGTTSEGGNLAACPANSSYNPNGGCGTVFALTPPQKPGGKWKETVLYAFSSRGDGSKPNEPLAIDDAGNLFGTTLYGGSTGAACAASGDPFLNGCGTVFELTPAPGGLNWSATILYRFQGAAAGLTFDGQYPRNVVKGPDGNLYGATSAGGTGNLGTLFKLAKNGSGGFAYSKIFDFCSNCPSGGLPNDGLAIDAANFLYGTSLQGGSGGGGVIFRFSP